ncbi:MAG: AbrB/MazE/SpoVT family DNA-binding domain-containing protein [Clostridia bacterium]|nr:AbrB/MazE/SpoVT family DNA-binding domain-containing protein [Clostridia bacterium]
MVTVKVSTKGQLVIPAPLRRKCGLRAPGRALIMERKGELVVLPLPDDPVAGARGMLKPQRNLAAEHAAYKEERRLEAKHEKNLPTWPPT